MASQEELMFRDEEALYAQLEQAWESPAGGLDLSRLKAHSTVKNYKVMCETLGEPEKHSASKDAQLREWQRYFSFTKQGHKFLIGEVYEYPYPKTVTDAKSKYARHIETVLAGSLSFETTGRKVITRTEMYRWLGMAGDLYCHDLRAYQDKQRKRYLEAADMGWGESSDLKRPPKEERHSRVFFSSTKQLYDKLISQALKRLEASGLLAYGLQVVICKIVWLDPDSNENSDGKRTVTDKDGNAVERKYKLVYTVATKEEVRDLVEVNHSVMREMGYSSGSIAPIIAHGRTNEYLARVTNHIQTQYGWEFTYTQYWFRYDPERISQACGVDFDCLSIQGQKDALDDAKQKLNQSLCERLCSQDFIEQAMVGKKAKSNLSEEDMTWFRRQVKTLIEVRQSSTASSPDDMWEPEFYGGNYSGD